MGPDLMVLASQLTGPRKRAGWSFSWRNTCVSFLRMAFVERAWNEDIRRCGDAQSGVWLGLCMEWEE